MCDEKQLQAWAKDKLSRRQFGALSGAAALAACAPGEADAASESMAGEGASDVLGASVEFATEDGTMDARFFAAPDGPAPAVIHWPDIAGIRASHLEMAQRTAEAGYSVLLVNPYYRDANGVIWEDFAAWFAAEGFDAENGFDLVAPWREKLSSFAIKSDAAAIVEWLDAQDAVDTSRGIGAEGYCMGGPFTVYSTHAVPDRVRAAASFHGGGLVRDDDESPHKLIAATQAEFLIAIAADDDAQAPGDKLAFSAAAQLAGRPAIVEVYEGDHGWTVPDSPAYAEPAAEKAFADKLALYARAL